jgi:hypothetical protein
VETLVVVVDVGVRRTTSDSALRDVSCGGGSGITQLSAGVADGAADGGALSGLDLSGNDVALNDGSRESEGDRSQEKKEGWEELHGFGWLLLQRLTGANDCQELQRRRNGSLSLSLQHQL